MTESGELAGGKKRRYWPWVALGCVLAISAAVQLVPERHGYCVYDVKRANIATIIQSLNEYMMDHDGKYPATLEPLVTPDANGHCHLEGFNGRIPRDPWKREYVYAAPTPAHPMPRVFCFGRDGKPGGADEDEDVDSDHLEDE